MSKLKLITRTIITILLIGICYSCVDEIEIVPQESYESILVVEATITDQFINQKILLSRTFELDSLGPNPETNANVQVVDENGQRFEFVEVEPGDYRSVMPFAASLNTNYHVEIRTQTGDEYFSVDSKIKNATEIKDLYVERDFNENSKEGVSVYVDLNDLTNDNNYYKYEYEETYKIIAPLYSPLELVINNDDYPYSPEIFSGLENDEIVEFFVIRQFRPMQEQVCYNTVKSNSIILASTSELIDNNITGFRVRFIGRDNYIMQHRYSILVKQYLQSIEAHLFYNTMLNINEGGSLFSEVQAGFVSGNVFSKTNELEPVVGYFEVSSVSEARVYFNYSDLFPNEDLPPYYKPCDDFFTPDLYIADPLTGQITDSPLQNDIEKGYQYWDVNEGFQPYEMVLPYCGDCTVLGQNIKPDWWED